MELKSRKPTRIKEYNYSEPGSYFVTICVEKFRCLLSQIIVGEAFSPPENRLTAIGKIAEEELLKLTDRFYNLEIDKYCIMPNHIHVLFTLNDVMEGGASTSPTISAVVRAFKSLVTKRAKKYLKVDKLFQRSFHDHIVRGEKDYNEIWDYIDANPYRWEADKLYKR